MFGEHVKKLRKEKNITQNELSNALGVTQSTISSWESGRIEPNLAQLSEVSTFFKVSIDELIENEGTDIASYTKVFGEKLRETRKEKGLTQNDFAELLPVTRGAINNWENGTREPSLEMLIKICEVLNVSSNELLGTEYNENASFTKAENILISKYRILDTHGKELIDMIIEKELQRCQTKDPSALNAERIAAEVREDIKNVRTLSND